MPGPQRIAIVTGASQGIGAGLVDGFRAAGYGVLGTSRSIEPADEADYVTVPGDITDPVTAELVTQRAIERFGRIDCLVNNAGIFIGKPFTDYTPADFDVITATNLAGFFHVTQRAIGQMLSQGSGHVVNVSTSLVEHPDGDRPAALTALTKGGLAAVARSLAIEYASRGIRVNAVSLGVIQDRSTIPPPLRDSPAPPARTPGHGQRRGRRGALPGAGDVRDRRDPPYRRRPVGRVST